MILFSVFFFLCGEMGRDRAEWGEMGWDRAKWAEMGWDRAEWGEMGEGTACAA